MLREHFLVSERGTCSPTPRSPGFRRANPPRTGKRRRWARPAELRCEPAGSAFIIVPPAPGTGWEAGSEGGLKRAVPSASPAHEALALQVFPGRLPRARPEPGAGNAREGQRSSSGPLRAGRTTVGWRWRLGAHDAARGPARAPAPRRALVTAPPAPPPASASRFPLPATRPRSGRRALWGKRPLCAEAAAVAAAPADSRRCSRLSPACPATRRRRA